MFFTEAASTGPATAQSTDLPSAYVTRIRTSRRVILRIPEQRAAFRYGSSEERGCWCWAVADTALKLRTTTHHLLDRV